jgi:hypothetical protein
MWIVGCHQNLDRAPAVTTSFKVDVEKKNLFLFKILVSDRMSPSGRSLLFHALFLLYSTISSGRYYVVFGIFELEEMPMMDVLMKKAECRRIWLVFS